MTCCYILRGLSLQVTFLAQQHRGDDYPSHVGMTSVRMTGEECCLCHDIKLKLPLAYRDGITSMAPLYPVARAIA